MVTLTDLRAGPAHVALAPELGGGLARLEVAGRPVLRAWNGDETDLFSLASNILVPFSNRLSGGGFDWAGWYHSVEINLAGEAFPIHGDGFQKPWSIQQDGPAARMELPEGKIGPWRYHAAQEFRLSETQLEIDLTVTNTGADALPFGLGFHPWFPRSTATRLSFDAVQVWLADAEFLPTEAIGVAGSPVWDFSSPRPLPDGWINNAFSGWAQHATITQSAEAVSCQIAATGDLTTALVYSPDANADFFCFEPVSHPVDAFHLPGTPGLKELAPHQSMRAGMTISWSIE